MIRNAWDEPYAGLMYVETGGPGASTPATGVTHWRPRAMLSHARQLDARIEEDSRIGTREGSGMI